MKGRLLLDVIVGEGSAIFELLSSEDESLLIRGNSFLVLDLGLDIIDGVRSLNVESDGLSGESLNEDLHTSSESEHEMEGRFLLNVVISKSSSVLELLTGEDKSLLVRGDSFFILDLSLDVVNGVRGLNVKGDGLASKGLDEDLHTTSKSEDEVESGLLLDVVVSEGSAVLKLLSSEDESLLVRRNTFLILNLGLNVVDGVGGLDVESDGLAGEGLDENLHI